MIEQLHCSGPTEVPCGSCVHFRSGSDNTTCLDGRNPNCLAKPFSLVFAGSSLLFDSAEREGKVRLRAQLIVGGCRGRSSGRRSDRGTGKLHGGDCRRREQLCQRFHQFWVILLRHQRIRQVIRAVERRRRFRQHIVGPFGRNCLICRAMSAISARLRSNSRTTASTVRGCTIRLLQIHCLS